MNLNTKNNTALTDISLQQQRLVLRQQMASQRLVIESQLGPLPTENSRLYPRSKIMRFLTPRPELMKKILGLVIGASFIKSMPRILSIVKFLYSSSKPRR
jgi:hypothetical protein